MTHITQEQLQHIAKLIRIQLTQEDVTHLLPQLEDILGFVDQLQGVDTEGVEQSGDMLLETTMGVEEKAMTQDILANVEHTIKEQSIQVTGKFSEQ